MEDNQVNELLEGKIEKISTDTDVISIDEFVRRLPEWNIDQYVEVIKLDNNKTVRMLGVKGANFIAYKCGISIVQVKILDETAEYIDVMAIAQYRDRMDSGIKRQTKKGSKAPLENAVSKARRNAILAMIPHNVIVGTAKQSSPAQDDKLMKLAAEIGKAEASARAVSAEQANRLKEIGLSVEIVSNKAVEIIGATSGLWSVMQWKQLEDMFKNPDKYDIIGEDSDDENIDTEDDEVEMDQSDNESQDELDI